jgi:hypothetical protein
MNSEWLSAVKLGRKGFNLGKIVYLGGGEAAMPAGVCREEEDFVD